MRTLWTAVLGFSCAAGVWAQEEDQMTERRIERMKDRLTLSDEQVAKLRDIYKADAEAQKKVEQERDAKVKELLSEEQKKQYDELRAERGRGSRGSGNRGPGGGGGWMDRFLGPSVDQLKTELGLDDAQTEKIRTMVDEFRAKAEKRMEELREKGFQGLDWREEMQKFGDEMKALGDKVKEHLTPEQVEKYEKWLAERTDPGRFGGGNRGERTPRRTSVEERVKRAMEALKVESEEERTAMADLVKKVLEARDAQEDFERTYREKARELSRGDLGDEAMEAKLTELREERKAKDKTLSALRKELAEIVTARQEATLIEQGILK